MTETADRFLLDLADTLGSDGHTLARKVELLGGLDQPEVAPVDQVRQDEVLVLILFGHRDDEAQVGFGEFPEDFLVSLANPLGEGTSSTVMSSSLPISCSYS